MIRAQEPCFLNGNRGFAFQKEQAARYSIIGADSWNLGMDQKNRLHPHERKLKKIPPSVFCCPLPISKNTSAEVDYSGGERWAALLTVRRRKVDEAVAVVYAVVVAASASEFH